MIQKVSSIPWRFYQLALLNVGLVMALSKGFSLFYIVSSLLFIALVLAPVAVYFKILSPPIQILHEQIERRMKEKWGKMSKCVNSWQSASKQNQTKALVMVLMWTIQILVAIYVFLNFVCPELETFLAVNLVFMYLFMHEQFSLMETMMGRMCNNQCPIACK